MAEGIKRLLKDLLFDLQHLLPSSFLVLTWVKWSHLPMPLFNKLTLQFQRFLLVACLFFLLSFYLVHRHVLVELQKRLLIKNMETIF